MPYKTQAEYLLVGGPRIYAGEIPRLEKAAEKVGFRG